MRGSDEILKFTGLRIGYSSSGSSSILLPPLDASADSGEMIAVIGKNGIGKSTLLKSLTGLISVFGGSIGVGGKDISEYSRSDLAKKIGYISTEIVRVNNMKVYDLVSLGRYQHTNWVGTIDRESHESILESIEIAGIGNLVNRYVSELSDGERQRAMIAMVLAQDTDIMIMDEPTAFLDVSGRYEIIHLMQKLTRNGKTIIFSTHDFNIAVSQSDKIWLMLDKGLIEGAPEDLILNGVMGRLFDSSVIKFNPYDGSFSFLSEETGRIFLESSSPDRYWFEKALSRAGISISMTKTDPYLVVNNDTPSSGCQLIEANKVTEFTSIYDLIKYLRRE